MGERALSDIPGIHSENIRVLPVPPGAPWKGGLKRVEEEIEIKEVYLIADENIISGGMNGDFMKFGLWRKRAGVPDAVIAEIHFNNAPQDVTALVPKVIPIVDTDAAKLQAGDCLYTDKLDTAGAGLALPQSLLQIGYEYRKAATS